MFPVGLTLATVYAGYVYINNSLDPKLFVSFVVIAWPYQRAYTGFCSVHKQRLGFPFMKSHLQLDSQVSPPMKAFDITTGISSHVSSSIELSKMPEAFLRTIRIDQIGSFDCKLSKTFRVVEVQGLSDHAPRSSSLTFEDKAALRTGKIK